MLRYLHNAGIVFHQPGLFGDRIVLDQAWALNAIYAVFDRTRCYQRLRKDHGRFDRAWLEELVWQDFSQDEQRLFLSMMRSCGICFIYRRREHEPDDDETIYIAPALLPQRSAVQTQIESHWGTDPPQASVTYDYKLLHPGLMRAVIARIGDQAGIEAIYWQGGVTAYETTLRSHAVVEHHIPRRRLRRHRQPGDQRRPGTDPAATPRQLDQTGERPARPASHRGRIFDARRDRGIKADPSPRSRSRRRRQPPRQSTGHQFRSRPALAARMQRVLRLERRGPWRESIVDQLEAEAKRCCRHLLRDKTEMRLGDRISEFMRQLVGSERVFVILSAKYLRSIYCMSELHEVWRRSVDDQTFLRRVRVFALPDADIGDIFKQLTVVGHWQERQRKLEDAANNVGWSSLSPPNFDEYKQTVKIARDASAILALVQDTLRPQRPEDLLRIAFEGLPPPSAHHPS